MGLVWILLFLSLSNCFALVQTFFVVFDFSSSFNSVVLFLSITVSRIVSFCYKIIITNNCYIFTRGFCFFNSLCFKYKRNNKFSRVNDWVLEDFARCSVCVCLFVNLCSFGGQYNSYVSILKRFVLFCTTK